MRWLLIPLALIFLMGAAPETCPPDAQAYIALLQTDRDAYIKLIDSLRLKLAQIEAQKAAEDEYWRQWFGLDKKK